MTITEAPTAAEREVAAKIASRRAAQEKFANLLAHVGRLLAEAQDVAILFELGALPIERVRAAQKFIGIDFRDLPLSPEADDFRALGDDMIALADAIDPMISAVGTEAKYKAVPGTITKSDHEYYFANIIKNGIEGSALCLIEQCAEAAEEEMMEAAE